MKTLEEQMSFYAAYHQDARNRATHFFGVPMIIVSLLVPLSWPQVDLGPLHVTAAIAFAGVVLLYYVFLDAVLAIGSAAFMAVFLLLAEWLARQSVVAGWTAFAVLFVGGWIVQLAGHAFEGRKPALADNLFQIFIAPIFLCAELFFALGYKPKLHAAVQARAREMRAAADAKPTAA